MVSQYLLECCINNGLQVEATLNAELLRKDSELLLLSKQLEATQLQAQTASVVRAVVCMSFLLSSVKISSILTRFAKLFASKRQKFPH